MTFSKATLFAIMLLLLPTAQAWQSNRWQQHRQDDPFTLRLRYAEVHPVANSDIFESNSGSDDIGGFIDRFTVSKGLEAAVTYYVNDFSAVEFSLSHSAHEVSLKGSTLGDYPLAKVDLYLPTVTYQAHFLTGYTMSPYLGGGLGYVGFTTSPKFRHFTTQFRASPRFGLVYEAGLDLMFGHRGVFNVAIKQVIAESMVKYQSSNPNITQDGTEFTTINKTNPYSILVGIGYRLEP